MRDAYIAVRIRGGGGGLGAVACAIWPMNWRDGIRASDIHTEGYSQSDDVIAASK